MCPSTETWQMGLLNNLLQQLQHSVEMVFISSICLFIYQSRDTFTLKLFIKQANLGKYPITILTYEVFLLNNNHAASAVDPRL